MDFLIALGVMLLFILVFGIEALFLGVLVILFGIVGFWIAVGIVFIFDCLVIYRIANGGWY